MEIRTFLIEKIFFDIIGLLVCIVGCRVRTIAFGITAVAPQRLRVNGSGVDPFSKNMAIIDYLEVKNGKLQRTQRS